MALKKQQVTSISTALYVWVIKGVEVCNRVLQRPIFLETTRGKPGTLLITPTCSILAQKMVQKLSLGGWTTQSKIFYVVFMLVLQKM